MFGSMFERLVPWNLHVSIYLNLWLGIRSEFAWIALVERQFLLALGRKERGGYLYKRDGLISNNSDLSDDSKAGRQSERPEEAIKYLGVVCLCYKRIVIGIPPEIVSSTMKLKELNS